MQIAAVVTIAMATLWRRTNFTGCLTGLIIITPLVGFIIISVNPAKEKGHVYGPTLLDFLDLGEFELSRKLMLLRTIFYLSKFLYEIVVEFRLEGKRYV